MSKIVKQEDVINRFIAIHGDKYDYSKFTYLRMKDKSIIICAKHGEFFQHADSHLRGKGCPICAKLIIKHKTHGLCRDVGYRTWAGMMRRCYNKNWEHYYKHGGMGITVSENLQNLAYFCEYIKTLENYDKIGKGGYSLDRIDTYGNYEEGNLRFATYSTQSINQRLRKNNKSGYTGIYIKKNGKVLASVEHEKKSYQKTLDSIESAVLWRNQTIKQYNLPNKIYNYETKII